MPFCNGQGERKLSARAGGEQRSLRADLEPAASESDDYERTNCKPGGGEAAQQKANPTRKAAMSSMIDYIRQIQF